MSREETVMVYVPSSDRAARLSGTPVRPLRALRVPPRHHDPACAHRWVWIPASAWNDAQRARADECVRGGPETPEFTPDCPGCEDVIGWRQFLDRIRRSRS